MKTDDFIDKFFHKWMDKDRSFFTRIYWGTQLVVLLLTIGIWYLFGPQYGSIGILWLINNDIYYGIGCEEPGCMEEWERGYPWFGVPRMFKSWRKFIPFACILGLLIWGISTLLE